MDKTMRGFTMIELVTVIVILGILAVVALPRMDTSGYAAMEFHDRTVATLRYAQKTAVSHRRLVCATFTATTVTLTIASLNGAAACNTNLLLPGANSNVLQTRDATNAIFTALPAAQFFQPDGRVTSNGAGTAEISLTLAITGQTPIAIHGASGYVN